MIFYDKITVQIGSAYSDDGRTTFGLQSKKVKLDFITGTGPVFFSFNGSTDHGEIGGPGLPESVDLPDFAANEIWFRSAGGGETVQVWAWN